MRAGNTPSGRPKARRLGLIVAALILVGLGGTLAWIRHLQEAPPVLEVASGNSVGKSESIIFFSGDTGLRRWSLGGRVAQKLAQSGYSVTGVDSLAAFSQRRTPEEATQILERAMTAALARNPRAPIVLIGQSFGSDLLVLTSSRLPPDLRERIAQIILIVPGTQAYLQVSPGEILGLDPPDAGLVPLIRDLPSVPITCIFGAEETDSLCPSFTSANATAIRLPGGHPLRRDTAALFSVVMRALNAHRPDSAGATGQEA